MSKEINLEFKKRIQNIGKRLSIGFSTSKTLAAHIVIFKVLGIDREIAILCMKELARRREYGQDFDYETFIEEELTKIPKMKGLNMPEIGKKIMLNEITLKSIMRK